MNTVAMCHHPVHHLHLTDENDFFMYHTFHILRYFFNDHRFDPIDLKEICGNKTEGLTCLEQMSVDFADPEGIDRVAMNATALEIFPKIVAFVCRLYNGDKGLILEQALKEDYGQIPNYDFQLFRDGYLRIANRVLYDDQGSVTVENDPMLITPAPN